MASLALCIILLTGLELLEISGQTCDRTLTATEEYQNETAEYGSFSTQFCQWTISASASGRIVSVAITPMTFDDNATCNASNGVVIYDNDTSGDILGLTCHNKSTQYLSASGSMVLRFPPELVVSASAFTVRYRDYAGDTCGGTVKAEVSSKTEYFNLLAPGYPTPTSSPLDCLFSLSPVAKDRVRIRIDVDGTPPTSCNDVNVTFYERTYNKLTTWCPGNSNIFQSWRGSVLLEVYVSPGRTIRIQYIALEESQCQGRYIANKTEGNFTTPDFPSAFPGLTECRWIIESGFPDQGSIELELTSSDLQETANCDQDVVYIVSSRYPSPSSTDPVIATTCNNQVPITFYVYKTFAVVVFKSWTETNTKTGFIMKYKHGAGEDCNKKLIATDAPQRFQSPGFPYSELRSARCRWTITTENPDYTVEAEVVDSKMYPYSGTCAYAFAYVAFFEGNNVNTNVVDDWFHGSQIKRQGGGNYLLKMLCTPARPVVRGMARTVTVAFNSNIAASGKGVLISYKQIPVVYTARRNLVAFKGPFTLTSPQYPNGAIKDADIIWTITRVAEWFDIFLSFDDVNLGTECSENFVKVYDGNVSETSLVSTLCGKIRGSFVSRSGSFNIVYRTDSTLATRGFSAQYDDGRLSDCKEKPEEMTAYLSSPTNLTGATYNGLYLNSVTCLYRISTVTDTTAVKLVLTDIDIPDCDGDSLEIFDGPSASSPVLLKICGGEKKTLISTTNSVFIRFTSDSSLSGRGFTITYEANLPDSPNVTGIIFGVVFGVLGLGLIVFLGCFLYHGKRNKYSAASDPQVYKVTATT